MIISESNNQKDGDEEKYDKAIDELCKKRRIPVWSRFWKNLQQILEIGLVF